MTGTKKNVQISEENGIVPPLFLIFFIYSYIYIKNKNCSPNLPCKPCPLTGFKINWSASATSNLHGYGLVSCLFNRPIQLFVDGFLKFTQSHPLGRGRGCDALAGDGSTRCHLLSTV